MKVELTVVVDLEVSEEGGLFRVSAPRQGPYEFEDPLPSKAMAKCAASTLRKIALRLETKDTVLEDIGCESPVTWMIYE